MQCIDIEELRGQKKDDQRLKEKVKFSGGFAELVKSSGQNKFLMFINMCCLNKNDGKFSTWLAVPAKASASFKKIRDPMRFWWFNKHVKTLLNADKWRISFYVTQKSKR